MNKNRKLLSLICAFAMIVSVFSSFTIVNAVSSDEITQGITLTLGEVDEENNTIEVIAGFVGVDAGFKNGKIAFTVPDTVTDVTVVSGEGLGVPNATSLPLFQYSVSMGTSSIAGSEGEIATFLLQFSGPLSSDTELTLYDTSYMVDTNGTYYRVSDADEGEVAIEAASVTLPKNSSVTTTDATRAPEMEDDDEDLDDIIDVTSGITLTLGEVDTENNTVEIIAGFVGVDAGFKNGKIAFTVPDTVTDVTVVSGEGLGVPNATSLPLFQYSVSMGTSSIAGPEGTIATFLLQFSEALTSTAQITLYDTSYMVDTDGTYYRVSDADEGEVAIAAANVNIPAFDSDTEDLEEVGEIPMSDCITVSVDEEVAEGDVSDYYIVATVMKGDEEAVYGTDYVATYNGEELTYAQYSNLINGYFSASNVADLGITSMQEVIDNLVYVLYDENVTVSAQLVDAATSEILNPDDETQSLDTSDNSSSTFKTPTLTLSPSSKTVSTGTTVTIEATIKNPTDDGVLTIDVGDADDYVTKLSIDEDEGTVSFKAALAGTVKAVYEYTYTNPNTEKEVTISKTSTIKIKSSSSSGSSSSSSSSSSSGSTGSIAGATTSTSTGSSLYTTFSDLGDATWAAQAILALAQQGIVSGRGDGTFDPNGNITRAEYCQILVGAIGKTSESADSYFDDVASDAWYYHAVSVASNYGIVVGYGDGNFGPNDLITRQDMALMTYKAAQVMSLGVTSTTSTSFTDADQISAYALEAVASLNNAGIINGMGDGTYGPLANATRAQAAVILYQAFVQ
ncbi:MAG: S-layer homology domain-containing protein [Firmicutes bacterium]|nr:S-layer homology domain-containing protein [Bacillota bacterium]